MPITIKTKAPAKAQVSVEHVSKGETVTEQHTEEHVDVPDHTGQAVLGHPGAEVEISTATTINTGNYNSVKVGVSLRIHCQPDEIDETAVFVEDWLNKRMESLTSELEPAEA